ncbi:DNA polymerase III subunit beta [Glutamicibacter creatinolyticus]|uniref:DNA polymerase III subunit beta n=1 Tax=Glutamicibacter creatinolyticus TaxID=162496 RepID=UPI0032179279
MKLTIDPSLFREALKYAATAISPRPLTPIMAGVMLTAEDGRLRAFGADYERQAAYTVDANIETEGTVIVSANLLTKAAARLKNRADILVQTTDDGLVVSQGATVFKLNLMPVNEYPDLSADAPAVGNVDGTALAHAIHAVEGAAFNDESHIVLVSLHLTSKGNELHLAATDRYRLAVDLIEWAPGGGDDFEVILPIDWVRSMAKNVAGDTTLHAEIESGKVTRFGVTSGDYTTTTTVRQGSYPKILQLFGKVGKNTYTVQREELLGALEAVSVMVERKQPIRLACSSSGVITVDAGGEQGSSVAQIRTDNTIEFGTMFNPEFIIWALRALDADQVRIVPNGTKPTHITPATGNTQFLLMPVRES